MVKQNEHGRWFVKGTTRLWPTERQALLYEKRITPSAPLADEVQPVPKKRWWKR